MASRAQGAIPPLTLANPPTHHLSGGLPQGSPFIWVFSTQIRVLFSGKLWMFAYVVTNVCCYIWPTRSIKNHHFIFISTVPALCLINFLLENKQKTWATQVPTYKLVLVIREAQEEEDWKKLRAKLETKVELRLFMASWNYRALQIFNRLFSLHFTKEDPF